MRRSKQSRSGRQGRREGEQLDVQVKKKNTERNFLVPLRGRAANGSVRCWMEGAVVSRGSNGTRGEINVVGYRLVYRACWRVECDVVSHGVAMRNWVGIFYKGLRYS